MRFKVRPRVRLYQVLSRAARRANPDTWQVPAPNDRSYTLVRRSPVYFPDQDALANLLQDLGKRHEVETVEVNKYGTKFTGDSEAEIAAAVANQSKPARDLFQIVVTSKDQGRAQVDFANGKSARTAISGGDSQNRLVGALQGAVDRNCDPLPRSKRNRPLIEPIHNQAESNGRHELDVARKSARIGALWGAVAGLFSGMIPLMLQWFFTQPK